MVQHICPSCHNRDDCEDKKYAKFAGIHIAWCGDYCRIECDYCMAELLSGDDIIKRGGKTMCHNCGLAYDGGMAHNEVWDDCRKCKDFYRCPCYKCEERNVVCYECFKTAQCNQEWLMVPTFSRPCKEGHQCSFHGYCKCEVCQTTVATDFCHCKTCYPYGCEGFSGYIPPQPGCKQCEFHDGRKTFKDGCPRGDELVLGDYLKSSAILMRDVKINRCKFIIRRSGA